MKLPESVSRRTFLKSAGAATVWLLVACSRVVRPSPTADAPDAPGPTTAWPTIATGRDGSSDELTVGDRILWNPIPGAARYEVELHGDVVATTDRPSIEVGTSAGLLVTEGAFDIRVRAAGGAWSERQSLRLRSAGGIRMRHFDLEDDGSIPTTSGTAGAVLEIGSAFAYGSGKGVRAHATPGSEGIAYKNLRMLAVPECWVRLAVRVPRTRTRTRRVAIARIRQSSSSGAERLFFDGRSITCSSISGALAVPAGEWMQLQFVVGADGGVACWGFDGSTETLIGTGRNPDLAGEMKDIVSFGNDVDQAGEEYDFWLDEVASAERRLPWMPRHPQAPPRHLLGLDRDSLDGTFSFVFGSCNSSNWVPYRGMAPAAAAASGPDFVVHLGDLGYPDTGAYQPTERGYVALWSDLTFEEHLGQLVKVPWLYVASDHDLGGNNIDRTTVLPAASAAYETWHRNPTHDDARGRYGAVQFDAGRVTLIWVDALSERSPLEMPDGPDKTLLGSDQKRWLLAKLEEIEGGLVIIASQTTIGHDSDTGWSRYSTERREILEACRRSAAFVRWITGDHHSARWARWGDDVAEWGAAPWAERPQNHPPASADVRDSAIFGAMAAAARDALTSSNIRRSAGPLTSFGRVQIDAERHEATFEVRDHEGKVRVHPSGFRYSELVRYA